MSEDTYQQCLLSNGSSVTVSWVPVRLAKKSKTLKLKFNNEWTEGWRVLTNFGTIITKDKLKMLEQQHKNTRKVSDV